MKPTQAQIEANRRNAQLSTGPRTEQGKAKSGLNAVTHGLTAKTAVLPTDDPALYQLYKDQLLEELNPQTPIQLTFALQIVLIGWRLNTFPTIESTFLAEQAKTIPPDQPKPTTASLIAQGFLTTGPGKSPLERLYHQHSTLLRQFSRLLQDYRTLQSQSQPISASESQISNLKSQIEPNFPLNLDLTDTSILPIPPSPPLPIKSPLARAIDSVLPPITI